MSLLVYVTAACWRRAREHGLEEEVKRFEARVEESQSTSLFDPFPPPYLVKKKLGGRQARLIADHCTVLGHSVIRCLSIMTRASKDYKDFATDPRRYGTNKFDNVTDDKQLEQFVAERTQGVEPPSKQSASDEEYGYLYGVFGHQESDSDSELVFETEEWLSNVSTDRMSTRLAFLCEPCQIAADKEEYGLHEVPVRTRPGWTVWAYREPRRLLLLSLGTDRNGDKAREYAHRITRELRSRMSDGVLRVSRRAYPALILADDDLWIDLEKDRLANLALSPEETRALESARSTDRPFPLFINGRAGSGKSTVLQYLFADLFAFYLRQIKDDSLLAPPVYLTANPDLLQRAKELVSQIIRNHSRFTLANQSLEIDNLKMWSERAFRQFQPYVLSLLREGDQREKFTITKRVDYSKFCALWKRKFGRDSKAQHPYGPDLSWHVIRSYIKGMSSETYLDPEDYTQLPENQITVTEAAYRDVYERVWSNWYKPLFEQEGYWDDQDLTRYVLDQDLAIPQHLGVVCDEAQDFTRIELELLLRINVFSNRALEPAAVPRVPFAFAGDQFQTLNPTGFRWDAIKASFAEKFVFELNPLQRTGPVDLNYRELQYNYRSTDKIVRFSNYVQAMRAALFRLPDVKPQKAWALPAQGSVAVVWFRANDAQFWSAFRDHGNYVVLVPCAEGEESSFVDGDPILRDHIAIEDGVPANVLSASRAKGNEYQDVVVYGFGESIDDDVGHALSDGAAVLADDPDRSLPAQYFFNRLYVAVSRAKERLIVVDTEIGFKRLWRPARDETESDALLSRIKDGAQVWAKELECMLLGTPANVTTEGEANALDNARAFEADGRARTDSFLLRQAAQAYRNAGDQPKARECRARAFEADEKWLDAGRAFLEAGFARPDALRCLWRAGNPGWKELLTAAKDHPELSDELEHAWSLVLVHGREEFDALSLLSRFADHLLDSRWRDMYSTGNAWTAPMGLMLERLAKSEAANATQWKPLVAALERIHASGIEVPSGPYAHVYYRAEEFEKAIKYWDQSNEPKTVEYKRASALIKGYPDCLEDLGKLELNSDIRGAYEQHHEVPLNLGQSSAVVKAYLANRDVVKAYEVAWEYSDSEAIARAALAAIDENKPLAAEAMMRACIIRLVEEERWEVLASFASTSKFSPTREWTKKKYEHIVSSILPSLEVEFIRSLARSEALSAAQMEVQRRVSDFLKRCIPTSGSKWTKEVDFREVGAAFERNGRFIDALKFYESMRDIVDTEEERSALRLRWIVTKQRQLDHNSESGKRTAQLRDMEREISRLLAAENIGSTKDLPPYPALEPLTRPTVPEERSAVKVEPQPPDRSKSQYVPIESEMTIGPFLIQVARKSGRCNITNRDTLEVSVIRLEQRSCGGEVAWVETQPDHWACEQWGITVAIRNSNEAQSTLDIVFRKYGAEIRLML